jgi:hypothetical protein
LAATFSLIFVSCFETAPQLLEFSKEEYIPADLTIPLSGQLDLTYEIDQASIPVKLYKNKNSIAEEFIPADKGGSDFLEDYFDISFINGSRLDAASLLFEKTDTAWRLSFALKPKQVGLYQII